MLLNKQWITEEIRGNQEILRDKWQQRYDNPKSRDRAKAVEREVYSNTNLPQENKKDLKQPNLTPKESRKGRREEAQN